MRRERRRNLLGRADKKNDNLALEVEARQVVVVFFRDFQAIAGENQGRADFFLGEIDAGVEESVLAEGKRLGLAVVD